MKHTQDIHSQAQNNFAQEEQSTHNPAAQATAARLLILLDQRYAFFESGEPDAKSQTQLLAYIDQIKAALKDPQIIPEMPVIKDQPHPVAQMIGILLTLDIEPKETILEQLAVLVAKYPQADETKWTIMDAQWCINRFYNEKNQCYESISASPAKTLTLVCAAMLDGANHLVEAGDAPINVPQSSSSVQPASVSDEKARVLRMAGVLAQYLLQMDPKVQRSKCSGGRQHDLLGMLQGSYLNADNQPFEFIEDLMSFLIGQVSRFIQIQLLPKLSAEERTTLLNRWMVYFTSETAQEDPVFALLNQHYQDGWQNECEQWINARCLAMGIHPESQAKNITALIQNIADVGFPVDDRPKFNIILELSHARPFTRHVTNMQSLVQARNTALQCFKEAIAQGDWLERIMNQNGLSDLHTAEDLFQSLLNYADILLIGSDDYDFQQACQPMAAALEDYFNGYTINARLPEAVKPIKETFLTQLQIFKEQSHKDVITPFFQAMRTNSDNFENYWARIQSIPGLQLSDERIHQIINKHLVEARVVIEDDLPNRVQRTAYTRVTELSTYDINRLLLHGLHVPPARWSETYKQTLAPLCIWLLTPSEEDTLDLRALKKGYPPYLLPNMLMNTLLIQELQALLSEQLNAEFLLFTCNIHFYLRNFYVASQLFSLISPYFNIMIRDGWFLETCFRLFTPPQRRELWEAIKNKLPEIIQNGAQLKKLLKLDLNQLTPVHHDELWEAIKSKLPEIIQNGTQLWGLLSLNLNRLTSMQRAELWEAVKSKLPEIIQNGNQLCNLLALDLNRLTSVQRAGLWEAIKDKLPEIIQNDNQLYYLFALNPNQLLSMQRAELWEAVKSKLPVIIQDGVQLRYLLALDFKQLTSMQRAELWIAVKDNLPNIIKNDDQLKKLLMLSLDQLTSVQRDDLCEVIQKRLSVIIRNGSQLGNLFALDLNHLPPMQRNKLWEAFKDKLHVIIQNSVQLSDLLALNLEQLPLMQRNDVYNALKGQPNWNNSDLEAICNHHSSNFMPGTSSESHRFFPSARQDNSRENLRGDLEIDSKSWRNYIYGS